MKRIQHNEFYRLRAKELSLALTQMRTLIKEHNLSRGLIGESILRDFLQKVLPAFAKVGQGFVEYNGMLSNQCDIIIYDSLHYSPLYSFGEIEIVPSQAVVAVIEVKTNITPKRFGDVLFAFEKLSQLRVPNKYLFIFNGCNVHKIKSYFYGKHVPSYGRDEGQELYDHDNYESLPDAIISLEPDFYLAKGHYQDNNRDMKGYMSFSIVDNTDKEMACIQKFVEDLKNCIAPPTIEKDCFPQLPYNDDINCDSIKTVLVNEGFGLVDF